MFGLFRTARPTSRSQRTLQAQLRVEQLEDRNCPAAPSISGLTATHIGSWLAVEGTVSDDRPATSHVSLGGAASTTVTPDASGWFGYITSWSSGTQVTAQATDDQSQTSDVSTATVSTPTDANPFIMWGVTYGSQRQITVSGKLVDESPGGRVVTISGVASGTVTTDSMGMFSITLTATSLGTITASATDAAGHASNSPIFTLTDNAPQITSFACIADTGGWYELKGRVLDESPNGLTVNFGGAPVSIAGQSCLVLIDGSFDFRVHLNGTQTDEGTATAVVTDWWSLTSNTAYCAVHQTGL
jgi:hypothetical protein